MGATVGSLVLGQVKASASRMTDSLTEQSLIERCRKQDSDAFGCFIDLYQGRVFGFVRRMISDADEAADVTQEVFIRAYQHFGRFDARSSVKTWLFKIAHNLCVDYARRQKRTPQALSLSAADDESDAIEISDVRWQPELVTMNEELAEAVDVAIMSMSDKLRSVLLLHDRDDLAYDEIASVLAIPVGTVKSRLFLARAHLQNALAGYLGDRAQA
ncbi:MAG: sigma-70 family RNA polymerase sigma factor [Fimbriimonadaceae bacterium]